jgi:maleate cis-trans isomerase
MVDDAPKAAEKLAHAGVDAIAFGCTGASLFKGLGFDRETNRRYHKNSSNYYFYRSSCCIEGTRHQKSFYSYPLLGMAQPERKEVSKGNRYGYKHRNTVL